MTAGSEQRLMLWDGGAGAQEVSFSYGWNQAWRAFRACAKQELEESVFW